MADALSGLTEVASTVEDVVSLRVQQVLTANAVMPGTIDDYSSEVGPGMDSLKIPKFGNFSVSSKVENTAVDAQTNAFSSDDLPLTDHKVIQWILEDIASLQAKVSVNNSYIDQAGRDLAASLDLDLIDTLEAGVSAAAPDHKRAYAGASLAKADVLTAKELLDIQNVPQEGRSMLVHPTSYSALLNTAEFTKVNEIGSSNPVRNGQIGELFGFAVFMSSQAEALKSLFYHRSTMAYASQQSIKTEMQRKIEHLADRWSVSHLYGKKVLDSGKRVVLMGTA